MNILRQTIAVALICIAYMALEVDAGVVTIRPHSGMPTFFVDQKAEAPMALFEQEICEKDAESFRKAGFLFYSFIEKHSVLDLGWTAPDQYDYSVIDRVLAVTTQRVPDGYFLPKIYVWAPQWWKDQHPGELQDYALPDAYDSDAGKPAREMKHESFASGLWKQQAGEALRRMIRHILDSPYADRVMGIHIGGGIASEWHPFGAVGLPDTSEPMRQKFISYARQRYENDVARLRTAWGEPAVTFASIRIPTAAERWAGDVGMFRNPARSRKVIDYYECYHRTVVEAIDHFCRIVKNESQGRLLTCACYGYVPDMPYHPPEVHHRATALFHRLASVDSVCSPHSYWHRALGDHGFLRSYTDSLAARGKLFIDEADERTHLCPPGVYGKHAQNLWESLQVLRRAFAVTVTRGTAMWYQDPFNGLYFDDAVIRADMVNIKRWADYSMTLSRKSRAEVVVISSSESEFYLSSKTDFTATLYEGPQGQVKELARSGAPFDRYLIEDLEEGLVPDYKIYIFLDCFYLTPGQRAAIDQLKSSNRTLIWFYAPGFTDGQTLSLEAMQALTGIALTQEATGTAEVQVEASVMPGQPKFGIIDPLPRPDYPAINVLSPRFVPSVDGAAVWGRYTDTGSPALVVKDIGQWRSVYCPRSPVPAPVLRRLFRETGVHIYSDTNDNLMANESWVGMHAANAGTKTIRLPKRSPVYDVLNNRLIGEDLSEFSVQLQSGETALFVLSKPDVRFYVKPDGDDMADGLSTSSAWRSIDNGDKLEKLVPGDTVIVLPGTYEAPSADGIVINKRSGTLLHPITYKAEGEVTVTGWLANYNRGLNITGNAHGTVVDGFVFDRVRRGVEIMLVDHVSVRNCTFRVGWWDGICTWRANHCLFANNLFTPSAEPNNYGAINNADSGFNRIYNNTFIGGPGYPFAIANQRWAYNTEIKNNVFVGYPTALVLHVGDGYEGSVPTHQYNLYHNCTANWGWTGAAFGAGEFSANPLLDADYRLTAGSPAIGAGVNVGMPFYGAAPDLGAFEFAPHTPVASVGELLTMSDGTLVALQQAVASVNSGAFGSSVIFVQDESRVAGVAVVLPAGAAAVAEGNLVTVTGTLKTVNGVRLIEATRVSVIETLLS